MMMSSQRPHRELLHWKDAQRIGESETVGIPVCFSSQHTKLPKKLMTSMKTDSEISDNYFEGELSFLDKTPLLKHMFALEKHKQQIKCLTSKQR